MIAAPVRYHRASSLDDALSALAEEDARALAGGQSLLPAMKLRLARPSLLVDIGRLDYAGVEAAGGVVRIGALTTWDELARADAFVDSGLAAIGECAAGIGDLQVRNLGTIGGSLAHADPASDMPAVLLALEARVQVRSLHGERAVPTADLFRGPFLTALEPGELVTAVEVPRPPAGSGSAYAALEHPASGFALAGAAALVTPASTAIAVTGVAATPLLLRDADELAHVEVFGDRFAPADYRRALAATLVQRAVARARRRAEGDA